MLSDLLIDVRYALRTLVRDHRFSIVAIVSLGLGLGSVTALFSVADAVMVRPLPWASPDRLVRIEEHRGGAPGRVRWTITNGSYNAWRANHQLVEALAAWRSTGQFLQLAGEAARVVATEVSPSLFEMLGVRPALGRPFVSADAASGAPAAAILSHGLWQRRFGGERRVLGRSLRLDDRDYQIVGVMPPAFDFPDRETDVWLPFEPLPLMSRDGRQMRIIVVEAIARLKPGVSAEQASAEGTARARSVPDIRQAALSVFGSTGQTEVVVEPVLDVLTKEVRPAIRILLGAVGLLLGATLSNIVSMQLARATSRRQEAAVRSALGAGQWQLARIWLVESALVGASAGGLGVALAAVTVSALPALLPADFPRLHEIGLESRTVLFALVVTAFASVVCGTLPAWLVQSGDMRHLAGDRSISSRAAGDRRGLRVQSLLVIAQVSAACMLLTGGALLTRSFSAMVAADRGYDSRGLLTARLTFPHESSSGPQQTQRLELLIERLRGLPGVRAAAFGNSLPLLSGGVNFGRNIPSPVDASKKLHVAATRRAISPDYLTVLRSRITRGRSLLPTDTEDTVRVVVVNETFASQYLGPQPIGLRLQLGPSAGLDWEVVGVVDDLRSGPLSEVVRPEFFISTRQEPDSLAFDPVMVVVRTDRDPDGQASFLRDIVREAAPGAALDSIMSMDDRLRRSLGRPRAYALVFTTIAALAVAIAAAGVFGLLSYTTALRTREIGVRLAIGAAPRQVASLIVSQALRLILLGVFTGTAVTFGVAELMSHFIYGIAPRDVVSFLIAPVALGIVGLLAAALPARHAARLDPTEVLRAN